jgi:hypothetical protein
VLLLVALIAMLVLAACGSTPEVPDVTHLYRIHLGVNIRAGAHYTQFLVYDFDGDGRSEMMFKTAPGTKVITYRENGEVAASSIPYATRRARVSAD